MTAALLFAASFAFVFTLGIQQLNVERRLQRAAFFTSQLIGLSQLVLFQVLPGPVQALEVLAFLLGNGVGIVASMRMHPHLVAMFARRPLTTPEHAERMGERLRLATELADDVARSDIESYCAIEHADKLDWYDTHHRDSATDEDAVVKALRYLDLRHRVTHHPQQPHLVRFER